MVTPTNTAHLSRQGHRNHGGHKPLLFNRRRHGLGINLDISVLSLLLTR